MYIAKEYKSANNFFSPAKLYNKILDKLFAIKFIKKIQLSYNTHTTTAEKKANFFRAKIFFFFFIKFTTFKTNLILY